MFMSREKGKGRRENAEILLEFLPSAFSLLP
jgi:hypothetical protein